MTSKSTKLQKLFAENMKAIRTEKGISQEDLGFKAGLDRTYISGIERGIRNPSLKNIKKIAKALKANVIDLFTNKTVRN